MCNCAVSLEPLQILFANCPIAKTERKSDTETDRLRKTDRDPAAAAAADVSQTIT